ncbi:hypothetical protein GPECTOR_64g128 [Gonium pectorale]|uniref:Uncharacterized protein n=1 Tax=Gonium pectorale TaxID=33097 RepID=A0A150G482_GONPE|nr:hypothetical protein GPECTOR_64g128 [Gonium pectorale]|eukprot:KXZ44634.1 hypothetical protein GPECTOR_64g128 [Gonium pectorale]
MWHVHHAGHIGVLRRQPGAPGPHPLPAGRGRSLAPQLPALPPCRRWHNGPPLTPRHSRAVWRAGTASQRGAARLWEDEDEGAGSAGRSAGSASSSSDDEGEGDYVASGGFRVQRLLTLAGAVGLELLLTGSLVWTPLAAAAVAFLLLPASRVASGAAASAATAEAVRRAEARVRAEMAARQPVSPPESGVWVSRMMAEFWGPYMTPLLLGENLGAWADQLRRAAPPGWELELVHLSMGRQAPSMGNYQVLADAATGRVTALDCEVEMDSPSVRAVVRGSGPVGRFTATVAGVRMKGRMRMLPVPEQRMLLFSFREPPDMDVNIRVKGPVIGERSLSSSSLPPLRSAIASALADSLVEPRRGAISLDPEPLVGQPVDTVLNIYVESVQGLPPDGHGHGHSQSGAGGSAADGPPTDRREREREREREQQDGRAAAASAEAGDGEGPSGSASASSMVAAASHAASAAGEAVVEGAGAIASLVPGLAAVAGDGGGKRRRKRLQVRPR